MPTRVNEGTSEFGSDDGLVTAYMYEKPWYYAPRRFGPSGDHVDRDGAEARGWHDA